MYKRQVVDDTTPQLGGDLDGQGNKVLFANVYSALVDLPSASTYHGMFAHVHATGKGYFAHNGNWIELANSATTLAGYGITDAFDGAYGSLTGAPTMYANSDVDTHLNQSGPTDGYVLSWTSGDYAWVANAGGGIASVVADTTPQLGGDLDVNGKTIAHTFTLGADGTSNYTFSDAGNIWFPSTDADPVLYLRRGEQYIFVNSSGGSHPFQIRVSNGGSPYNTGVTNNGASSGNIIFKVPMSAPATLYYQCTSHSGMGNTINIV